MPRYFPYTIRDGDGVRWTFDSYGRVTNAVPEFSYGFTKNRYNSSSAPRLSEDRHQINYEPATYGDLKYSREVYVSQKDGFVRYLEIYKNTGGHRLEETVTVNSSMSDYTPDRLRTADGDAVASPADHWLVRDGDGQRAVSFVLGGPGGDQPETVTFSGSQVGYGFDLDLAPHETQIVMHFVALDRSLARAIDGADDLAALKGDALHGLSQAEKAQIVNFTPGKLTYNGTERGDRLIGAAFDETYRGRGGNDRIEARDGDDRIYGDAGHDGISAGGGHDRVYGGPGRDSIAGGDGSDQIWGDGLDRQTTTEAGKTSAGERIAISLTLPDASDDRSVEVSGFVSRTPITSSAFNVAFVIDTSSSTASQFRGDVDVGDRNGDGRRNTILDAEIAGFEALLDGLSANVGAENLNVAVVAFGSDAETMLVANAARDRDGDGVPDVVEALRGLRHLGNTNFEAGLQEARDFFDEAGDGQNFVFFLSDGEKNTGGDYVDDASALRSPSGAKATIRSFGVGQGASEEHLDLVDDQRANDSVQIVLDPSRLSEILIDPRISRSDVDRVELTVNGKLVRTIPGSDLETTPLGLDYTFDTRIDGLRVNRDDEVRARLVASDGTVLAVRQVVETVEQSAGADRIAGGEGNDIIRGGGGNDRLAGDAGNDDLYGEDGNDALQGGDGNDVLDGGAGKDRLAGGGGNDTYFVDRASDVIVEADDGGTDRVVAAFDYTLGARLEHLTLVGSATRGEGNAGNNVLRGSAGANTLLGRDGNDSLAGGNGTDTLTGGGGNDRFLFAAAGEANADLITDFGGEDRIVLDAAGFDLNAGALSASAFVQGAAATSSFQRILYDGSTGVLRYDADGTGTIAAERIATLSGAPTLSAADFLVA